MKKKLFYTAILAAALAVSVVSCGNKNNEKTENKNNIAGVSVQPAATSTTAPTVAPTTEPVADAGTATPVPTPTKLPTPTATTAPEFTATPTPTATSTPEPTPTTTPEPTAAMTPEETLVPEETVAPTPTPVPEYTYTKVDNKDMWLTANVNMRMAPDKTGEIITTIPKGTKLVVTARCNETNWYEVTYNNATGYMCDDYFTDVKPTPTPTPTPRPTATPRPTKTPKPTTTPRPTPTPMVLNFTGDNTITIRMVGDALIHKNIYQQCKQSDGSYNADNLYKNVKSVIKDADIAIINQETILVEDEDDYSNYPQFGSPFAIGQGAVDAGFDVIAHATNHTMDKGLSGVRQTLDFWRDKPVTVIGIHESAAESDIDYVYCEGAKISFVNYTYGLNGLESRLKDEEYIVDRLSDKTIEKTVATAKKNSDLMIAVLHVGTEYVYTPSDYAIKQVDRFIDAGADIVLCAHPHVVETYGMRTTKSGNTALVYYSLGNFVSGQNKVPRMIGGMADITLGLTKQEDGSYKVDIISYNMVPLITHLQGSGRNTVYFLSDYTEELCTKHRILKEENYTLSDLYALYYDMVDEASYLVD